MLISFDTVLISLYLLYVPAGYRPGQAY